MHETKVVEFIQDLDGGVLEQKLGQALSDVAAGVVDHNKAGQVTLTLDMKRIGNSYQVEIKHKLSFKRPTAKGDASENNTTSTPMYIGTGGKLSLFPEGQDQMFGKDGTVNKEAGHVVD